MMMLGRTGRPTLGYLLGRKRWEKWRSDAAVNMLMGAVKNTAETEIPCREAGRLLDEYVEREKAGQDVASLMPSLHHHLSLCMDCSEEYKLLRNMVRYLPPVKDQALDTDDPTPT